MGCTSVEPLLKKFFKWYAYRVFEWRWPCFLVPIFLSVILSVGFLRMESLKVENPSYVFTPRDARWRRELKTVSSLWPLKENKFLPGKTFETTRFVHIVVQAKDGGDVLRPELIDEAEVLNQWILNNITIETVNHKFILTYQDLCMGYDWVCGENKHLLVLKERRKVGQYIDLSYPKGGTTDVPVYLGGMLGGVVVNETEHTVISAKKFQMVYFFKQESDIVARYSNDFAYAIEKFLLHKYESDLIRISFGHHHSLRDGLAENAKHFGPNFVISFIVLAAYALIFSFTLQAKWKIDVLRSKPYLAAAGLITPLLALSSSFGLLLIVGVQYNVINTIIPFLLIAIGIDDMFIMNACWDQTDRTMPPEKRMSEMMAHAGVAVSITNITDILSFAIGCYTELPGIELFCIYACGAVIFCYIYQMTYFAGFQAIIGKAEADGRHCLTFHKVGEKKAIDDFKSVDLKHTGDFCFKNFLCFCRKNKNSREPSIDLPDRTFNKEVKKAENTPTGNVTNVHNIVITNDLPLAKTLSCEVYQDVPPLPVKKPNGVEQTDPAQEHEDPSATRRFFGHSYGPFLLKTEMRALVVLLYILFIIFAIIGCASYKEGLNPENLVTNNHYIAQYFHDLKDFWYQGPQLHVVVLKPPNFTDPVQREKMMAVVRAFENTEHTLGREGTVFFLLEYLNYLNQVNAELENTERLWNTKLRSWLKYTGGAPQWASDIKYNETDNSFQAFRFQIALKNVVEPNDHKEAAILLREIADRQPFNIEIFHETFPFADQYIIIVPSTIRNIIISLLCMSSVALLLVPSFLCCVLVIIAIISISVGVFGYMTFWGVNLDAISMISLIMSIGFAVDLSAHIAYAFVTARGDSRGRVKMALTTLGWPIFQGATSTIAGISVLYTVNAYIILTFFKTIWLTMTIGLIHGLVFIPVALSFIPVSWFHFKEESHH